MAFFEAKRCLNSIHIVERDGRRRDQFYNISHVSWTRNQSSKSGNKCTEMYFHKHVAFLHFAEHQWHFTTLFLQVFFCLGVIIIIIIASWENSQGKEVALKSWLHIAYQSSNYS